MPRYGRTSSAREYLRTILATGSTDGKFFQVTATTTGSAQTLHTNERLRYEVIRLDAWNNTANPVDLNVEWVGTTSADTLTFSIPPKAGPKAVIPDWRLVQDGVIKVWASAGVAIGLYLEAYETD